MKELLISLVVALAGSAAQAAVINIEVNGQPWDGGDVEPGELITAIFHDDVQGIGGFVNFVMNISSGDFVDEWGPWWEGPIIWPLPEVTVVGEGFDFLIKYPILLEAPTGDIFWVDFYVHEYKQESDEILIQHTQGAWNNIYAPVFEPVTLHVVPEPASFFVLGLGAVLLYRRGRKR